MLIDEMKQKLQKRLSLKRYTHSINVMETAVKLAVHYGADVEKCTVAGLLHDCARDIKGEKLFNQCGKYNIEVDEIMQKQPELLHGHLGVHLAQIEYGVEDNEILHAIRCHTTGLPGMGLIDKIIYIADFIEPLRSFTGVEALRKEAYENIDRAVVMGIDSTIRYILQRKGLLHPDTIDTRNWFLIRAANGEDK